jgi:hypothetical protein
MKGRDPIFPGPALQPLTSALAILGTALGTALDRSVRGLTLAVVEGVDELDTVQLREPVRSVRAAILVGLDGLGEPLTRLVLTPGREERVGVRVPQARGPRLYGAGGQLGALKGHDGRVELPHIPPGTGRHEPHLDLPGLVQLVHLGRPGHVQRLLGPAHTALAVGHDGPQVDVPGHAPRGPELGEGLAVLLVRVRGEAGRFPYGGDARRQPQGHLGVPVRPFGVFVDEPGDHHEVLGDILGERLGQALQLLPYVLVDLLAGDVLGDRQPLDRLAVAIPLLAETPATTPVVAPPTETTGPIPAVVTTGSTPAVTVITAAKPTTLTTTVVAPEPTALTTALVTAEPTALTTALVTAEPTAVSTLVEPPVVTPVVPPEAGPLTVPTLITPVVPAVVPPIITSVVTPLVTVFAVAQGLAAALFFTWRPLF